MAELFKAKVENGIVRLYAANGVFERVICAGAIDVEVLDEDVIVTMPAGKRRIYSVRGFFKRNG